MVVLITEYTLLLRRALLKLRLVQAKLSTSLSQEAAQVVHLMVVVVVVVDYYKAPSFLFLNKATLSL